MTRKSAAPVPTGNAPKRAPVAEALRARLLSGLHLGIVAPGDRLPSVRQLATEFEVNPRVVLAAISDLERAGLVEVRDRSGAYVLPAAVGDPAADRDWLTDLVTEAIQRGLPIPALADEVRRATTSVAVRVAVIECNDDQLFSVSEELERDYGVVAVPVDLDDLDSERRIARALRGVDLLVTTATHGREVRKLASRVGLPVLTVAMCTDLYVGVGRLLPDQRVYFVITDPRFAAKLRASFASMKGARNLRILIAGRDDLSTVPADSPMYVTRVTRRTLGEGSEVLTRIVPEPRIFSRQSAREIVSFLVSRNANPQFQPGRWKGHAGEAAVALDEAQPRLV